MADDDQSLLLGALNGDAELDDGVINRLETYVEVTPRAISIFNLQECAHQLALWEKQPLRLILAAKAAHLSLQAALIDALAGSTSIGAYKPKLRAAYLAYFNQLPDADAKMPSDDFVMHFKDLIKEAKATPLEGSGQRLEICEEQQGALDCLSGIRDSAEHPSPGSHYFEPRFVLNSIPTAVQLTARLLDERSHEYNEGEHAAVAVAVSAIVASCE